MSGGMPTILTLLKGQPRTSIDLIFSGCYDYRRSENGSRTLTKHRVENNWTRGRSSLARYAQAPAVELSKSYRGRKVVDNVELEIGQGEVVGLLGPNGAGKTTTFYILVGLARPDSGRVLLNGDENTDLPVSQGAERISYLLKNPRSFSTDQRKKIYWPSWKPSSHSRAAARSPGGIARANGTGCGENQQSVHAFAESGGDWRLRDRTLQPYSCCWTNLFRNRSAYREKTCRNLRDLQVRHRVLITDHKFGD